MAVMQKNIKVSGRGVIAFMLMVLFGVSVVRIIRAEPPRAPYLNSQTGAPPQDGLSITIRVIDQLNGSVIPDMDVSVWGINYVDVGQAQQRFRLEKRLLINGKSSPEGVISGRFVLSEKFPQERYIVTALSSRWAGYMGLDQAYMKEDFINNSTVDVVAFPRSAELRVRVVDPFGGPVSGCTLVVLPCWGEWGEVRAWHNWPVLECGEFIQELGLTHTTDENGEVFIRDAPSCQDIPEECDYVAFPFDQEYTSKRETFDLHDILDLESGVLVMTVRSIDDLAIAGVLVDEAGNAVGGADMFVNKSLVTSVDSTGWWRVSGRQLGDGPWNVCFRAKGFEDVEFEIGHPELLLNKDANNVRLTMKKKNMKLGDG